ncbi:uncharacterized protein BDW47DRAFT_99086 [Aspergillus candidus]|uniref:Uncharacterized protein n=1 Tax=Aspergillus candidus TaxID=41067 RepID=A0A2I2FLE6_ASPCN|nr:hypothetical protein BDW47DRAFT_99086 [Aspergillus candidus]PLB41446.1 hypothetical protein BDW47DRAFT_99086 [Aspergillus candidus]
MVDWLSLLVLTRDTASSSQRVALCCRSHLDALRSDLAGWVHSGCVYGYSVLIIRIQCHGKRRYRYG